MCSNENTNSVISKASRLKYQQVSNNNQSSVLVASAPLPTPSSAPQVLSSGSMTLDSAFIQQQSAPTTPSSSSIGMNPGSTTTTMSTMLSVPSANLLSLDHYRFQLYNYAMAERLRCAHYSQTMPVGNEYTTAAAAAAMGAMGPYGPRLALSMSLFHNRVFQPEEPKPQHSYIGLIAIAILSSPESKLVLSDIYQHILDNYPYFRSRGPGWRNSIRHNLSLNDCFVKAGRSANGKGHYWAIHPANQEDFKKGDFRRRKAQRKVRKHMGLAVDDEGTDSPSPPPLSITPPPMSNALHNLAWGITADAMAANHGLMAPSISASSCRIASTNNTITGEVLNVVAAASQYHHHHHHHHHQHQHQHHVTNTKMYSSVTHPASARKRQFDVASLLAPDHSLNDSSDDTNPLPINATTDIDEDIDVEDSGDHESDHRKEKLILFSDEINPRGQKVNARNPDAPTDHIGIGKQPLKLYQIQSNSDLTESEDDLTQLHRPTISSIVNRSSKLEQLTTLAAPPASHQQQPSSLNNMGDGKYGAVFPYLPSGSSWPSVDPRILVERYYGQYMVAAAVAQQNQSQNNQKHITNNNNNSNNNHNLNGSSGNHNNHHHHHHHINDSSTPSSSPLHAVNSPRSTTPNQSSSPTNLSAM